MRIIFTIFLSLYLNFLSAQNLADFENFNLASEDYLNGEDGSGGYSSGSVFLPNSYSAEWSSWSGWAISNTSDITTPGFLNQYSAITGMGNEASTNYAVSFVLGESRIILNGDQSEKVDGLYLTNSTYAYLSIRDGDAFSKKFGGVDGSDPDFFLLTIKKYLDGQLSTDSIDFYLADYRFENSDEDYIVDEWTFVDLSSLGQVDSLSFTLSSTDVGQFGMNTPAYFCIDDVQTSMITSTNELTSQDNKFDIYAQPSSSIIKIINKEISDARLTLYTMNGQALFHDTIRPRSNLFEFSSFGAGSYIVSIRTKKHIQSQVVILN